MLQAIYLLCISLFCVLKMTPYRLTEKNVLISMFMQNKRSMWVGFTEKFLSKKKFIEMSSSIIDNWWIVSKFLLFFSWWWSMSNLISVIVLNIVRNIIFSCNLIMLNTVMFSPSYKHTQTHLVSHFFVMTMNFNLMLEEYKYPNLFLYQDLIYLFVGFKLNRLGYCPQVFHFIYADCVNWKYSPEMNFTFVVN